MPYDRWPDVGDWEDFRRAMEANDDMAAELRRSLRNMLTTIMINMRSLELAMHRRHWYGENWPIMEEYIQRSLRQIDTIIDFIDRCIFLDVSYQSSTSASSVSDSQEDTIDDNNSYTAWSNGNVVSGASNQLTTPNEGSNQWLCDELLPDSSSDVEVVVVEPELAQEDCVIVHEIIDLTQDYDEEPVYHEL